MTTGISYSSKDEQEIWANAHETRHSISSFFTQLVLVYLQYISAKIH